jgi:hypothetical protein
MQLLSCELKLRRCDSSSKCVKLAGRGRVPLALLQCQQAVLLPVATFPVAAAAALHYSRILYWLRLLVRLAMVAVVCSCSGLLGQLQAIWHSFILQCNSCMH